MAKMQTSEKAYEAARSLLAHFGASADACRGLSMEDHWREESARVDPKACMDQWAKAEPVGFKAFQDQAQDMAQDLLALARISPATARRQGDLAIFCNAKCSAVAKEALAERMAPSPPQAPGSRPCAPKP